MLPNDPVEVNEPLIFWLAPGNNTSPVRPSIVNLASAAVALSWPP